MDENKTQEKKGLIARWKLYAEISKMGTVARRYFVMNFTDGLLTTLGIIIGFLVIFLRDPSKYPNTDVIILPGVATAIAMGVSGIMGSHLIEDAERAHVLIEMEKAMARYHEEREIVQHKGVESDEREEIMKHMIGLSPEAKERFIKKQINIKKKKKKKKEKSINEKAQSFATYFLAIVDGLSPFLGAFIVLIPFLVALTLSLVQFIIAFVIIFVVVTLLAAYLAKLSEESIIKYTINFLLAVVITIILTLTIGQIQTPSS
jgi:predicted membrane protein (TIGR00267 family)